MPALQYYSFLGLWLFIFFVVGDMILTSITRQAGWRKAKFGATRPRRVWAGTRAMRTIQMRFMRLPKPQVKRGQHPD